MTDKEKAIRWFENIANECDKLTSGNVAHLRTQIKGMAIRSAEYLKKQEQPASEDLAVAVREQMEYDGDVDDFVRRGIDDIALKYAALGAQWCDEQMIKILDAEKEGTGIGLCEYDTGHENGRMELIDTLKKKLSEI